jgi:hypothetical protein
VACPKLTRRLHAAKLDVGIRFIAALVKFGPVNGAIFPGGQPNSGEASIGLGDRELCGNCSGLTKSAGLKPTLSQCNCCGFAYEFSLRHRRRVNNLVSDPAESKAARRSADRGMLAADPVLSSRVSRRSGEAQKISLGVAGGSPSSIACCCAINPAEMLVAQDISGDTARVLCHP